jgi:hypothetical protein
MQDVNGIATLRTVSGAVTKCKTELNSLYQVTRTMPVGNGGKFTETSKQIYSLVLEMQQVGDIYARCTRRVTHLRRNQ